MPKRGGHAIGEHHPHPFPGAFQGKSKAQARTNRVAVGANVRGNEEAIARREP
jgi:hypothetical protein